METKCNHTALSCKFCPNCGVQISTNVLDTLVTTAGFIYQRQHTRHHPDMKIVTENPERYVPIDRNRTVAGYFISTKYSGYGIENIHCGRNMLLREILILIVDAKITDPVWCGATSKGFEFTNIGDLVTPIVQAANTFAVLLNRINYSIIYDDQKLYDPIEFATYVNSFDIKKDKYKIKPWVPTDHHKINHINIQIVGAGWDALKRIAQYEKDLCVQKTMLK